MINENENTPSNGSNDSAPATPSDNTTPAGGSTETSSAPIAETASPEPAVAAFVAPTADVVSKSKVTFAGSQSGTATVNTGATVQDALKAAGITTAFSGMTLRIGEGSVLKANDKITDDVTISVVAKTKQG